MSEINIDIEPVLIELGKKSWVHPDIANLVQWEKPYWIDDPADTELCSSQPVYRVYLENKARTNIAFIVFTSKYFDEKEAVEISEHMMNCTFSFTDEEGQALVQALDQVLSGPEWKPGGELFSETKMHRKLKRDLGRAWSITFISPDVSLCNVDGHINFQS